MAAIGIARSRKIEDYRQAVLRVGGDVRIVDPAMSIAEALNGVGGVLLTGGEDIDPARYAEARHPSVTEVDPQRDEFEIALLLEALARRLPILAICRGVQVLNVAYGGRLGQDIPSPVSG